MGRPPGRRKSAAGCFPASSTASAGIRPTDGRAPVMLVADPDQERSRREGRRGTGNGLEAEVVLFLDVDGIRRQTRRGLGWLGPGPAGLRNRGSCSRNECSQGIVHRLGRGEQLRELGIEEDDVAAGPGAPVVLAPDASGQLGKVVLGTQLAGGTLTRHL